MIFFTSLIMIAWIPIVLYLFYRFSASEAVIISFIVAWLFLPQRAGFSFPGLPDYERMSATVYGIILCVFIYDAGRFRQFKPSWLDLPMLVWCICPLFSSLSNGLGIYDGVSEALKQTVAYGGPYFLGRLYLNNLAKIRFLAIAIFLSGLVYVPFCLYEIRFSPQLHRLVYGYHPHFFAQSVRYGGYRPVVFMQHGLAVGMWMMAATLIGIWLWKTEVVKSVYGIHIRWLVGILLATFILTKSTGAYGLLIIGIGILFLAWQFRTSVALIVLVLSMFFYLQQNVSANSNLSGQIIGTLEHIFPSERIQSVEYRFNNEEKLIAKAAERKFFGWGGWGRNRIMEYDWKGELVDSAATDSLWIIAFGTNGLVGLIALYTSVLLPVLWITIFYFPASTWSNQKVASAAVIIVVVTLFMLDCLLNDMQNPVFILATGGITGLTRGYTYE